MTVPMYKTGIFCLDDLPTLWIKDFKSKYYWGKFSNQCHFKRTLKALWRVCKSYIWCPIEVDSICHSRLALWALPGPFPIKWVWLLEPMGDWRVNMGIQSLHFFVLRRSRMFFFLYFIYNKILIWLYKRHYHIVLPYCHFDLCSWNKPVYFKYIHTFIWNIGEHLHHCSI